MESPCPQDAYLTVIPSDCRGSVDFSLAFENYILTAIPAAILILLAPIRLRSVWHQSIKVISPTVLWVLKTFASLCFVAANLLVLIESTTSTALEWRTSQLTAASLTFIASLLCLLLSYAEHHRSIRPSILLQLYLMVAVVTVAVHLRSVWPRSASMMLRGACSAQLASCAAFLAAESCEKESILLSRDKRSPQDINDLFSQRLFLWLNKLFANGYNRILSPLDLFTMDEDLTSQQTQTAFAVIWALRTKKMVKLPMYFILALSLRKFFFFPIIPRLLMIAVSLAQPFFIERLISFIEDPEVARPNEGALLTLAVLLMNSFSTLLACWYWQSVNRFTTKLRYTLTSAIHDKVLSARSDARHSPLMLMNVDVEKACVGLRTQHEFWANILILIMTLYLLKLKMGLTFLAPLVLVTIMLWFVAYTGSRMAPSQKAWLAATQRRISFVTDIISSMKNVKVMGLVQKVMDTGIALRDKEVHARQDIWRSALWNVMLSHLCYQVCIIGLYGAYAINTHLGGPALTNRTLFYSLALLKLWAAQANDTIQLFPEYLSGLAALTRIQKYLLVSDHQDVRQEADMIALYSAELQSAEPLGVKMASLNNVSAGYPGNPDILHNLTIDILQGRVHIIIGLVGSGKSSLLKTLLGEIHVLSGTITMATFETSFCDLPPYLWSATIRENIIGMSESNQSWFDQVIWACGLDEDLRNMHSGAETQAGDEGTSLSGGQKNRISLARALYARKRLFIGDDILSGLDTRTEALVFTRVFGPAGLLRKIGATAVFATHSVGWLKYADTVIIMDDGKAAYQGPPSAIPASFSRLISHSTSIKVDDDDAATASTALATVPTAIVDVKGFEGRSAYRTYLNSFGANVCLIWALFGLVPYTARMMEPIILQWWANASSRESSVLVRYSLTLLGTIALDAATFTIYLMVYLLEMSPKSSIFLHKMQWESMVKVIYSAWHKLGNGDIVNRFSQDMALVDLDLTLACLNTIATVTLLLVTLIVVIVASPYIAASFPLLTALLYLIQKVYLRTSKQLRVMDLEAKTPLCSHFLETVTGVVTITAYGWTEEHRIKGRELLDKSQIPYYILTSIQQWLALVLNLLVAVLTTILVGITVANPKGGRIGLIGTALINLMTLGEILTAFVQQWARLDTSIGAVVRIQDFCGKLPPEEQGIVDPGPKWLEQGRIDIRNMTATYSPGAEPILRNINLFLSPGQKIALCGRTGSGKSSLASAMFGLLHIISGTVLVDGVDVTTVSQDRLRSSMIALPQDPYFLPGTVRENLALRDQPEDEEMLAILAKVNLLPRFEYLAANNDAWNGPLDVELSPSDMLTRGQQQLFAMARATLSTGSTPDDR